MIKNIKLVYNFLRERLLLSLAIVAIIVGLVLQIFGYHLALELLLGAVSIFECIPLALSLIEDLRTGTYGIDILALTAIIVAVVLRQDWAAIVVVLMITGGESLEDFANKRATNELSALLKNAPAIAHLVKNGKIIEVKAKDIKSGDKFLVRPGELVPVDGLVIEGTSSFDESSLTGESLPSLKDVGSKLLSGSINMEGLITAKATASAEESQYQQIIKLVQAAEESKAPFVRLADKYSIPFTLIAYAIALSVGLYYGSAVRFLDVIIVATPCPLLIAAPIALISGMSKSSKYGVIIKSGTALEKLASIKTIAFDKTGTLTTGKLTIKKIKAHSNYSKDDLLSMAASMEQFSNHVIARAIVNEAATRKLKLTKVKKQTEVAGRGLVGSIKSQKIIAGRIELLDLENISYPKNILKETEGFSAVYMALDGKFIGYIALQDSLRGESKTTIKQLKDSGIEHFSLITGDNQSVASSVAKSLGIDQVVADALPGDKLTAVEDIKLKPVAFIGDGVNDAPVLTASDLGIALGARGSTAASESADIVVMPDNLQPIASVYKIAKYTFSIARQSILVGIGLSLALMVVFATGRFKPLYGAMLQEVVDVVVIFNALRVHSFKLKSESK